MPAPGRPEPDIGDDPSASSPPTLGFPSKRWRDLILRAWHVEPLRCPICQSPMRVIAVIDDPCVVENILRHFRAWHPPARRPVPAGRSGALYLRTL